MVSRQLLEELKKILEEERGKLSPDEVSDEGDRLVRFCSLAKRILDKQNQ